MGSLGSLRNEVIYLVIIFINHNRLKYGNKDNLLHWSDTREADGKEQKQWKNSLEIKFLFLHWETIILMIPYVFRMDSSIVHHFLWDTANIDLQW